MTKAINRGGAKARSAERQRGTGVKTWAEVKACLHGQIEAIRNGYTEASGRITDPEAIHDIACLRKALRLCVFALKKEGARTSP